MLDNTPIATPTFLVVIAVAVIAYLNHDLSVFQALLGGGVGAFGAGAIGHARNGSGRGVRTR